MTITVPTIIFPIIASVAFLFIAIKFFIEKDTGWVGEFFYFILGILSLVLVIFSWTIYYTVLYFLK